MVSEAFAFYLTSGLDMSVATAKSLDESLHIIAQKGPFDLVLLDLNMPGMNGIIGLKLTLKANGGKPVAIITGNTSPRMFHVIDEIMTLGAAGIILKTSPAKTLGNAIRFMHAGEYYMPLELLRDRSQVNNMGSKSKLSGRELGVLSYLAEGRQNKDIASQLQLAEPTIKMHVTSICKKLGAQNRTQAVIAARNLGMI
jgi:DNA-binding NarL/FixJ family response regulator